VSYRLKGVAHTFALPHDLAHFLVEKTLDLDRGFWTSVAEGAVFKTMDYLDGRRKPKAAERSGTLLKSNAPQLSEAEVLVRIFNDTIEQGNAEGFAPTAETIARAAQASRIGISCLQRGRLSKWRELPVGGRLDLR